MDVLLYEICGTALELEGQSGSTRAAKEIGD